MFKSLPRNDELSFTNSSCVCSFASGNAASPFASAALGTSPRISVSASCGRGNVRSNASVETTTPPSSSSIRGGWKSPITRSASGRPFGARRTKRSPTTRRCLVANVCFTSAPWPSSCASVASEEPPRQSKRYSPSTVRVSTAFTFTCVRPIKPRSLRMLVTCSTPRTPATASPAAAVNGDQPFCEVTTQSAASCCATALSTEPCTPLPSTATKETSASPIISAAAVAAVREGFRTAFCEASRPADDGGEHGHEPRGHARGADEQRQRAERESQQRRARAEALAGGRIADEEDGKREQRRPGDHATAPARLPRQAVLRRRDRGHPRRPHGRHDSREKRDERAEQERDDDRAGRVDR